MIGDLLERSPDASPRELARKVVDFLGSSEVERCLIERVHAAVVSADAAWLERPDLFLSPRNSEVAALVAASAISEVIVPESDQDWPPQRVAAAIKGLRYKDWKFDVVHLPPSGVGVRVRAPLRDSRREDGRTFHASRVAPVRAKGPHAAAFSAVMMLEEHEARERFFCGDRRPLDPHSVGDVPPPANQRSGSTGESPPNK